MLPAAGGRVLPSIGHTETLSPYAVHAAASCPKFERLVTDVRTPVRLSNSTMLPYCPTLLTAKDLPSVAGTACEMSHTVKEVLFGMYLPCHSMSQTIGRNLLRAIRYASSNSGASP